jgi:hypothetical protein
MVLSLLSLPSLLGVAIAGSVVGLREVGSGVRVIVGDDDAWAAEARIGTDSGRWGEIATASS